MSTTGAMSDEEPDGRILGSDGTPKRGSAVQVDPTPGATMGDRCIEAYLSGIDRIPSWFERHDARLFQWLLADQRREGVSGDLLEIGVYRGKSAILLGYFVGTGERLVVCDPFSAPVTSSANAAENTANYPGLTVEMFRRTYTAFHAEPPVILACSSTELPARMEIKPRCRFIHVDGSHLYDIVRQDIEHAKELLVGGGVVVFDDYRSFHTPGVAAAVWEELGRGELAPLCVTDSKLYAQWSGDAPRRLAALKAWSGERGDQRAHVEAVFGREMLRIEPIATRRGKTGPGGVRRLYWWLHAVATRRRRGRT